MWEYMAVEVELHYCRHIFCTNIYVIVGRLKWLCSISKLSACYKNGLKDLLHLYRKHYDI